MEAVFIKLIDQLPAILTAIGVIVTAVLSYRTSQQSKRTEKAVEAVHDGVNSKMQQLIEVTARSSHAAGKLEERSEQGVRDGSVLTGQQSHQIE